MDLGEVGLFTAYRRAGYLDHFPTARAQEVVTELEELGFPALWIPGVLGRDAITHSALLLAGSRRIVVATGIASIYARDAVCMVAGERLLAEAFPQRFLLGLGVSHREAVEGLRGHRYDRPLAAMRAYLEAMDGAVYKAVEPASPPPRVLAALGPKMLALSAERADGAMPYLVPVEHTARAREIVGPGSCSRPGSPSSSRPTRRRLASSRGRTSASTCAWRTTRAASAGSASARRTSAAAARTVSSRRSWRRGTRTRFAAACASTSTRAPTTWPSRS
jgi:alkanesulfonate monooxygenase SsuD/methylene tetrahydromethanopterin reductase-like flavin-dependent oxidoreductase (luciferase family)